MAFTSICCPLQSPALRALNARPSPPLKSPRSPLHFPHHGHVPHAPRLANSTTGEPRSAAVRRRFRPSLSLPIPPILSLSFPVAWSTSSYFFWFALNTRSTGRGSPCEHRRRSSAGEQLLLACDEPDDVDPVTCSASTPRVPRYMPPPFHSLPCSSGETAAALRPYSGDLQNQIG